jgi:hypothetical protein
MNPELTVLKNAEVDLCWGMGGGAYFAALHRLADGTWDAWLTPSHTPVSSREEPTELLTPAGGSYEMALADACTRRVWPTSVGPGLPGSSRYPHGSSATRCLDFDRG